MKQIYKNEARPKDITDCMYQKDNSMTPDTHRYKVFTQLMELRYSCGPERTEEFQ